jgi:hydroxymethylglutaryl-CoA lyase
LTIDLGVLSRQKRFRKCRIPLRNRFVANKSKLLAIIANTRGAQMASSMLKYLGYPFSISENFQMRNTHKTIAESLVTLDEILEIADKTNKKVCLFVYGFGNPYGDPWDVEIVEIGPKMA